MAALFKNRPAALEPGLTWRATPTGFRFTVSVETAAGVAPLRFPLAANPKGRDTIEDPRLLEACLILDDLLLDEVIQVEEAECVLPFLGLQRIDDAQRAALGLPSEAPVQVRVYTRGIVSTTGYQIVAEVSHPDHGKLEGFARRYDNVYRLADDDVLVLPQTAYELLRAIESGVPADIDDERLARLTYQERVKRRATLAGAALEGFLANETYILPEDDSLSVAINAERTDKITVSPSLKPVAGIGPDAHASINRQLAGGGLAGQKAITATGKDGGRVRAILDRSNQETIDALKPLREITGADVPRFLDNPEAFLPEGIDLSDFSDRVTGIAIERVSVRPSIAVHRRDGGVFEFDAQLSVQPIGTQPGAGFPNDQELSSADLDELIRKAKDTGEDYILYKNRWVHVDVASLEHFRDAVDRAKRKYADKKLKAQDVKGFLEIFTNVDSLEYGDSIAILQDLLRKASETPDARYPIPASLRAELFPYQRYGYAWLRFLDENRWGGLLADDMGLGKTLQAISLLAALKELGEVTPSMVVLPLSVMENWERELRGFCPSLRVYSHQGSNRIKDRDRLAAVTESIDVFLTTYETLRRDQIALGRINWKAVILDEAQNIKNPATGSATASKALKSARSRIALTGTPVENGLSELWSIFDFVQPGHLGSYREFRQQYEKPIQNGGPEAEACADALKAKIKDLYLRRLKEDELGALPSKTPVRQEVGFGEEQLAIYADYIRRGASAGRGEKLAIFQKLVQVSSHPTLVKETASLPTAEELVSSCPKLAATLAILDRIHEHSERALIFTEYKKMQEVLLAVIHERYGIWAGRINGDVLTRDRQKLVDEINNQATFGVLVLSPTAGGVGLNITGANHVIHYTRTWNPAKEAQATDRVYRLGQKRPVTVYYPLVTHADMPTIETRIDALLAQKSALARDIIRPSQGLNITQTELEDLLGLTPSKVGASQ